MKKTAAAVLVALAAVLALGGCTGQTCPKGQTLEPISYVPVSTGKVVVIVPLYGCEP